jgi:hypothetical protein
MDNETHFKQTMAIISTTYDKEISEEKLGVFWLLLGKHPVDQIRAAVIKHIEHPQDGKWIPKPADILKHINGAELTADDIIAMARTKSCPLGCMAAIKIGSNNLKELNHFELKVLAEEVLLRLPKWKERADNGDYRNFELEAMIKYHVDPVSPFHAGLLPPREAYRIGMKVSALPGPVQEEAPSQPVKIHTQEEKQAIINSIATIGYKPRVK